MKRRLTWLAAALAAGGLATAVALSAFGAREGETWAGAPGSREPPAGAAAHAPPGAQRTVSVAASPADSPSSTAAELRAWRVAGQIPSVPTPATVLTDKDCAPDAGGISRCLNEFRLRDGRRLRLRHPHRMSEVPCLSPGERVTVAPA